ncbi:MAG: hypothetical protein HFH50_03430 [Lachnospiraceae bacterium]|jgi:hypothetical protein|nr:hypothetical protein [Lachnospiraceae bacterium]MCI9059535.1 hypothetical protein [Lachnospiraceae bacterium]GFI31766.1 hypothetical protein IMSAGC013_03164 [Lachnospiraceae bacterium]
MTGLLEMREKLRTFYGKYELYVTAGLKFVLGLVVFSVINGNIGYMERLNQPAAVLLLSLLCAFFPINAMVVLACGLILLHLFAVSMEACAIGLCLFLLLLFLYGKFAPRNGYSAILTTVLCFFRVPQVMPAAVGMLKGPSAYFSVLCGTVTYYYLRGVQDNLVNFTSTEETEGLAKFTAALKIFTGNKEMYLVLAAFLVTSLTVYLIRRQAISHAWRAAMVVGNVLQLIIFLLGYILLDLTDRILWVFAGILISMAVCLVLEFFLYNLDYSRVERVQFEDDEYYYFVKAVPKVFVAKKEKRVKRITARKRTTVGRRELAEELDIDQDLLD